MINNLMDLADKRQKVEYEREKEEGIILTIRSYREEGKDDITIAATIKKNFKLSDDKVRELMARA